MVGQKSDLLPLVLGRCAEGRCLPHGLPERVERGFGLSLQPFRSATHLKALHQASRRLTRRLRPASYFHWKHRAAVKVRPDAVGQVRVTPGAPGSASAREPDNTMPTLGTFRDCWASAARGAARTQASVPMNDRLSITE